jgi:hypothetical protein
MSYVANKRDVSPVQCKIGLNRSNSTKEVDFLSPIFADVYVIAITTRLH